MGAISPSVFLTRDFIEYVLPTLVAVLLLAPFATDSDGPGLEIILSSAVAASFLASAFAEDIAGMRWLRGTMAALHHRRRPGWSPGTDPEQSREDIVRTHTRLSGNWDYDRLFYSLSQEDREYVYLTRAYMICFQTLSLYLLLYATVNLLWLACGAVVEAVGSGGFSWHFLTFTTPMLGGWSAPTVLLILIAYLLFDSMYSWHLGEAISLFDDDGIYPEFAAKHQRADGGLATAVWGRVHSDEQAVRDAAIELFRDGVRFARTRTDEQGRFQFRNTFRPCLGHRCELRIKRRSFPIELGPKEVPEFDLDLAYQDLERAARDEGTSRPWRLARRAVSGAVRLLGWM